MSPIEIRLDPQVVRTLLDAIAPVLERLEGELASSVELPEDDELMENFWKSDLLNSQREELAVFGSLFDETFMESGRARIEPEDMDKLIRACSAIRLKLRETGLKDLSDEQLERGEMEDVDWTDTLQVSYAAYSLFASLQELIVSQVMGGTYDEGDDFEDEAFDNDDDE